MVVPALLLPLLLYPYSFWPPLWKAARPAPPAARSGAALLPGLAGPGAGRLLADQRQAAALPAAPLPAFALLAARLLDEAGSRSGAGTCCPRSACSSWSERPWRWRRSSARGADLPSWAPDVSPGVGVALLALAAGSSSSSTGSSPGGPAAPTLITLALRDRRCISAFAEAAREAYDLEPISRYLSVLEQQGRPIAYVGAYHGQFHFLGRLERPVPGDPAGVGARLDPAATRAARWSRTSTTCRRDASRAELTQPYRDDVLAVWGREGIPGG